jgi:hypothetical protein
MGNIKDILTIVKPETILLWQKQLIKRYWKYKVKNRAGRPPVKKEIKQIILKMKNDNLNWGYKKIQGELLNPRNYKPHFYGKVQKLPILGGLHHHYFRSAA